MSPITPRGWVNDPDPSTPLDADGQIDQEQRMGAYADSVAAGGIELEYAEITSDVTHTTATASDVSGLAITFVVGVRPIMLEFGAYQIGSDNAGCVPLIAMQEGSTIHRIVSTIPNVAMPLTFRKRLAPSPGTVSYKITFNLVAAVGTGTIKASSTNGNQAYFAAYEV